MNQRLIAERLTNAELVLLPPEILRPTEECLPERILEVTAEILRDGVWKEPILIERSSMVVMDGHHRRAFALQYGLARVPCLLATYSDVALEAWRDKVDVNPEETISRGLTGRLYPPKSTRHTLLKPAGHICDFPLAALCEVDHVWPGNPQPGLLRSSVC